jgi:hypothetical protein
MPRPLVELLREKLGTQAVPHYNPLNVPSIGTVAVRVLGNNPNRYTWEFVNLSPSSIFLHLDNTVSASRGWLVGPSGGSLGAHWEEDFELVSGEWWAIGTAPALSFLVYEVESGGA